MNRNKGNKKNQRWTVNNIHKTLRTAVNTSTKLQPDARRILSMFAPSKQQITAGGIDRPRELMNLIERLSTIESTLAQAQLGMRMESNVMKEVAFTLITSGRPLPRDADEILKEAVLQLMQGVTNSEKYMQLRVFAASLVLRDTLQRHSGQSEYILNLEDRVVASGVRLLSQMFPNSKSLISLISKVINRLASREKLKAFVNTLYVRDIVPPPGGSVLTLRLEKARTPPNVKSANLAKGTSSTVLSVVELLEKYATVGATSARLTERQLIEKLRAPIAVPEQNKRLRKLMNTTITDWYRRFGFDSKPTDPAQVMISANRFNQLIKESSLTRTEKQTASDFVKKVRLAYKPKLNNGRALSNAAQLALRGQLQTSR